MKRITSESQAVNKARVLLKSLLLHSLGVLGFIGYELSQPLILTGSIPFQEFVPFYIWEISMFYFASQYTYRVISQEETGKVKFVIGLIATFGLFMVGYLMVWLWVMRFYYGKLDFVIPPVTYKLVVRRDLTIMAIAAVYWLVRHDKRKTKEANDLNIAVLQAKLPSHMIMNALNMVYNQFLGVSEKATSMLLRLSNIMRSNLEQQSTDLKVDLLAEVAHMKDNIAMNRLRFGEQNNPGVSIDLAACRPGLRIPPNLLFNLAENLFKHGDLSDPTFPATLVLSVIDNELHFSTKNKKKYGDTEGWQTGLTNTRIILAYLYKNKHDLNISNNSTWFGLELKMSL